MSLLGAAGPLGRPQRVVVAGSSGSGKSTLCRRIAVELGIPHIEIDGLFHGPGWTPRPSFEADVHAFMATEAWVTEWQYRAVRTALAERADLMVWLDLPRWQATYRVSRRTLSRRLRRRELWNGNVEPPLHTILRDPDHIVRWSWRTYPTVELRVASALLEQPGLPVVRLCTSAQVAAWVAGPLADAAQQDC